MRIKSTKLRQIIRNVITEHFRGNQPLPSDRAAMQRYREWEDAQRSLNRKRQKENPREVLRHVQEGDEEGVKEELEYLGIDPRSEEGQTWREWHTRSDGGMDYYILDELEKEGYVRVS